MNFSACLRHVLAMEGGFSNDPSDHGGAITWGITAAIYDAAAVDGATGLRRFTFVTFPLLANLYLVSTLLSTLWTVGDFTTTYFVSSGAPALMTEVLGTYTFRMTFDYGYVELGLAAALSTLPVMIPVTILLIRRLQATEVQL